MSARILSFVAAVVVAAGVAGPISGCGPSGGGDGRTVSDPPPLPAGETTEELIKQRAKSGPRSPRR